MFQHSYSFTPHKVYFAPHSHSDQCFYRAKRLPGAARLRPGLARESHDSRLGNIQGTRPSNMIDGDADPALVKLPHVLDSGVIGPHDSEWKSGRVVEWKSGMAGNQMWQHQARKSRGSMADSGGWFVGSSLRSSVCRQHIDDDDDDDDERWRHSTRSGWTSILTMLPR